MLSRHRFLSLALVATPLVLAAQAPADRIQTGFRSLSTGSWDTALRDWARDGLWTDTEGKRLAQLESMVSMPRGIGRWEAVNPPYLTATWQRHWIMATFDQGALFFVFDYVHHKGAWRLVALQATREPSETMPHLDLMPGLRATH
jgi:hypothetical protein